MIRRTFLALPLPLVFIGGCDSRPKEVGVFIKTSDGWKKPLLFDWEPMFGGYAGSKNIAPDALPKISGEARVIIQGVPIDPQGLYWGRNAKPRRDGLLTTTMDNQPATVSTAKEGVFEVKPEKLPVGLHALVQKGGQFSFRGYFFEVVE